MAITHVGLIDVVSGRLLPDSTVVIQGTQVLAVGPAASTIVPRGAAIVDGLGKFLIPGLADMHLHLTGAGEPTGSREFILPLLVANGITTVRDMGGDVDSLKQLRHEIDSGQRFGPQIFFTGPYLDGDPPAFQPSIVVRNPAEARQAVRSLKSRGVDFIKVQSRLQPDAYFSIARESRDAGLRFVGHVPDTVSARAASIAGQSSIEHLTGVLLACSPREDELRLRLLATMEIGAGPSKSIVHQLDWRQALLDSYSEQKAAELFQVFVANHTAQVPTFPLLAHLAFVTPETDLAQDPRLRFLPSSVRAIWDQARRQALTNATSEEFELRRKLLTRSMEVVRGMQSAGVLILAGTDSTAPNVFPGSALHEDLYFLVKAGLTPLQALQSATIRPAEFLDHIAQQGSIESGKRADLILLDANPLEDIRNTGSIRAVVLNGKLLQRADLDALLTSAARFAASH